MAMRRDWFLTLFFCYAVVSEVTQASLWDSRKLLDPASKENPSRTSPVSPLISPVSTVNISDSIPVNGKKKQTEPPPPAPNNSSSNVDLKVNNSSSGSSPTVSETGNENDKPFDTEKENKTEATPKSSNRETCDGVPDNKKCRDQKKLVACIQSNPIDSRDLTVLVLNKGEDTLEVKVTGGKFFKGLKILKYNAESITIPLTEKNMKLVLDAGNGECVLYTSPPFSGEDLLLHLPSFDQLATPVNGAYFLILAVLIFGGSWACCRFRRRHIGGVPYQELEMSLPESSSAVNVETADGWDQGWDDDWDEENAVKSPAPGGPHIGSISANGLTARANKDGWENDWDV